jgi:Dynein light chain type 1
MADAKKQFQRAVLRSSDMTAEIRGEITDSIVAAIDKFPDDFEAASRLVKDHLDKQYSPAWHCAIGKGFSFGISSQEGSFLHVYYQGDIGAVVFKC